MPDAEITRTDESDELTQEQLDSRVFELIDDGHFE